MQMKSLSTSAKRPNLLYIMSDDHAAHAMSCYGSRINRTPNMDRIANQGMRFDNCFCTNSICTPSRAAILTGTYNHVNGVTTLTTPMDNRLTTYPKLMQAAGYQTAIFGKWHLGHGPGHHPTGFDDWAVFPAQGEYHNPEFLFNDGAAGQLRCIPGYVTDIVTDLCLDWLQRRDPEKPFALMCHHKAPHRHWEPDEKHAHLFLNQDVPLPKTLHDDYRDRASAAREAKIRIDRDMGARDWKCEPSRGMPERDFREWAYQRYIKDYLRVVASLDNNIGRLLDVLDAQGLTDNTLVVYTSDQGFFLGDHGWYDKRFMYEESLRMPFICRYPREISPGSVNSDIVCNVDFASTFLDVAGIAAPEEFQGRSFRAMLQGNTPDDWRQSTYYRYWMHDGGHNIRAHYGIRTRRHKLIYYYSDGLSQPGASNVRYTPEWELFDLEKDPCEMMNLYGHPEYVSVAEELKQQLHALQDEIGDTRYEQDRQE